RLWREPVNRLKQLSMLVAALVLGVLVSVQWPTIAAQSSNSPDQVGRTIQQLELEQQELKHTIANLRQKLDARQKDAAGSTLMLQEVRGELALQKMRAGLTDVRGPGVQVVLDDGPRTTRGGDANGTLIHDYDLRDVVNVLWMAGAEAISANDERIVSSTSIYCVGSTVMVNDTRLSPPYEINAIGDPVQLQDHLRNPGYLSDIKSKKERFDIKFEFIDIDTMTIPAFRGSLPHRFIQSGNP
ncbi:MAG: DUF881 domain-containing protein, partial [Anaerolineae bacterium]|nr:DUF881 domain-containing protein [Anaerolineae bacterium]